MVGYGKAGQLIVRVQEPTISTYSELKWMFPVRRPLKDYVSVAL